MGQESIRRGVSQKADWIQPNIDYMLEGGGRQGTVLSLGKHVATREQNRSGSVRLG